MAIKTNLIQFPRGSKKKKVETKLDKLKAQLQSSSEPIVMSERRETMKEDDRRQVTRTVLSQFIGVFVVLDNQGLQPVSLYDISEEGLSFDLSQEHGQFQVGETVTMRIYLSHDMYFSFNTKVANVRSVKSESAYRHGAVVLKDHGSYKAVHHFMKFLENVAAVAKKDSGDRLIGRVT
jgi:hypothetical protein